MNLPWHIVRKDLRRFWLGALLLAGIALLKFFLISGVFAVEIDQEWMGWMGRMRRYQNLLLAAQWILTFIVALAVVHEDPVSEAGAFWEILPVTRRQLLFAKCVSVLSLTLVPVLLVVVMGWGALGLSWATVGWPIAVTVQAHVGLALLALALGSLTRNIAHVIFWMIGAYLFLMIPVMFPEAGAKVDGLSTGGARLTLACLFTGTLLLTCLAVILNQFLAHSRRRSVILLCVGIGLATTIPLMRPSWDALSQFSSRQQQVNADVGALPVKVTAASVSTPKPDAGGTTLVRVAIDDRNAPFVFTLNAYFGKWIPAEGKAITSFARIYQAPDRGSRRAAIRALGFGDSLSPPELTLGAENQLPSSDAARLRGKRTSYEGQFEIIARSVSVEGELELAPGASLRSPSGSCRITRVENGDPVVRIELEARDSGMIADRGGFLGVNALVAPVSSNEYVLVNHATRSVLTTSRTSAGIGAYAYGVLLSHGRLEFVLPGSAGAPDLAAWKLARVRYGPPAGAIRSFRQEVQLDEVTTIERDPSWMQ